MTLYVWRDMFVVWESRSQTSVFRVGKIVPPAQSLIPLINLIAVGGNAPGGKVQFLSHTEAEVFNEKDLAFSDPCVRARGPYYQSGTDDAWTIQYLRQEAGILLQRVERVCLVHAGKFQYAG